MSKAHSLLSIAVLTTILLARNANARTPDTMPSRASDTVVVDSFDSLSWWYTNPSAGVEVSIHPDNGLHGRAIRVDFDFHGHQGYWIIHRDLELNLPPNFQFNFSIRGQAPANNLEFKLVDHDRESVWWTKNPNFNLPRDWQSLRRRKREICYAWGGQARPYYDLRQLSAIEFAMSTGTGGKGSVWIDDLTLTSLGLESPFAFTAPVASNPLIGTWETAVKNPDGSGAKLDFETDGTFRSIVGFMAPFKYTIDENRLTTDFRDSPVTEGYVFTAPFSISHDTLIQKGDNRLGQDIVMKRVSAARGGPPIRGVWTYNDNSGATSFVAFGENGEGELRIPTRICSSSWTETPRGHIVVNSNGEIRDTDYYIDNDVLTLKYSDHETRYKRRIRSP
jgi:hypothetical protein